jgi:hypothetical protein
MVNSSGMYCATSTGEHRARAPHGCNAFEGNIPEILLTLCYNDLTGKLAVGIDRGSCLRLSNKCIGEIMHKEARHGSHVL